MSDCVNKIIFFSRICKPNDFLFVCANIALWCRFTLLRLPPVLLSPLAKSDKQMYKFIASIYVDWPMNSVPPFCCRGLLKSRRCEKLDNRVIVLNTLHTTHTHCERAATQTQCWLMRAKCAKIENKQHNYWKCQFWNETRELIISQWNEFTFHFEMPTIEKRNYLANGSTEIFGWQCEKTRTFGCFSL